MAKAMSTYAPEGPAEKASERAWHTRCDGCGAAYDVDGWSKLGLVTRVESGSLAAHVTVWPSDDVVEVRRCERCARTVSRRRPRAHGRSAGQRGESA